ncbi:MAG: class I SAM-dependent methyltransferase [Gammaproteobacteria bacterium]
MKFHDKNIVLQSKYKITALFYDILDYPWERLYQKWRPVLVKDIRGKVLEAGVGTGRNLEFYHKDVELHGIELSKQMIVQASKKMKNVSCKVKLIHEDATIMRSIESNQFDWVFSTFMCCVMPDELQEQTIAQFARVLKPGGRFRLLEIVYSKDQKIRRRQQIMAPLVEKIYGARFDRNTLRYIKMSPDLEITKTTFLKDDTYLVIEGIRV